MAHLGLGCFRESVSLEIGTSGGIVLRFEGVLF